MFRLIVNVDKIVITLFNFGRYKKNLLTVSPSL